jgi:hypothetical protein
MRSIRKNVPTIMLANRRNTNPSAESAMQQSSGWTSTRSGLWNPDPSRRHSPLFVAIMVFQGHTYHD